MTAEIQRPRRLNGWQRIGVILSILWLPVGFYLGAKEVSGPAGTMYRVAHGICFEGRPENLDQCLERAKNNMRKSLEPMVTTAAITAFLPIPIFWGFVYLIIGLVRWVISGFKVSTR